MARGLRVIAGSAGGLHLVAPRSGTTRPTTDRVKESLFSALRPDRIVDADVLDLYAGSGALGIEALSRGAARALFVDRDRDAEAAIRRNLATTGFTERARVRRSSVAAFLARAATEGPFDLVFVDPPYDIGSAELTRVLGGVAQPGVLRSGGVVVVERSAREDDGEVLAGWQIEWRRAYGDTLLVVATR